jgi:hypothetical protein
VVQDGAGTPGRYPVPSVLQISFTELVLSAYSALAIARTYDNYVYDPKTHNYCTYSAAPYNPDNWRYYPNPADTTNYVDFAPAKLGLGSEYGYIKADNGRYHTYGRGGYAHATITPATLNVYDYKFTFIDGSYYTGIVVDDGTFGRIHTAKLLD